MHRHGCFQKLLEGRGLPIHLLGWYCLWILIAAVFRLVQTSAKRGMTPGIADVGCRQQPLCLVLADAPALKTQNAASSGPLDVLLAILEKVQIPTFVGLVQGKIYRNPWVVPSNMGVSCKCSLNPIQYGLVAS